MTKSSITGININWPHDSVHGYLQQVMKEFHYLYSICQHPPQETGVLKYMSEVFICRGGSGSGSGGKPYPGAEKVLQTYLITENQNWVVPNNIINNELFVRIAGGGGGYSTGTFGGGGSGWMNNGTFKIGAGSIIPVKIGRGGGASERGGTTSFGTYLMAYGGTAPSSGHGGDGGSGGYGWWNSGGYGSKGGDADVKNAYTNYTNNKSGGGGGGYGGGGGCGNTMYWGTNGGDAHYFISGGGGGYCAVGASGGGGYYYPGGYGGGGIYLFNREFGGGGATYATYDTSSYHSNGKNGGCLIQFYQWL